MSLTYYLLEQMLDNCNLCWQYQHHKACQDCFERELYILSLWPTVYFCPFLPLTCSQLLKFPSLILQSSGIFKPTTLGKFVHIAIKLMLKKWKWLIRIVMNYRGSRNLFTSWLETDLRCSQLCFGELKYEYLCLFISIFRQTNQQT